MNGEIDKLRWIRAFSPEIIPRYLVEQVRDREFSVEDFYKYHNLNCTIDTEKGTTLNPFNHLYVLADDSNQVKGFLWFIIDPLTKDIIINTYSVDNAYWYNGKAVAKLAEHVKKLMEKLKVDKAFWFTKYPKHSQKNGFKRSKYVMMEYVKESEYGQADGEHGAQEEHKHADTRAASAI